MIRPSQPDLLSSSLQDQSYHRPGTMSHVSRQQKANIGVWEVGRGEEDRGGRRVGFYLCSWKAFSMRDAPDILHALGVCLDLHVLWAKLVLLAEAQQSLGWLTGFCVCHLHSQQMAMQLLETTRASNLYPGARFQSLLCKWMISSFEAKRPETWYGWPKQ